jgi:hypothetical protein
MLRNRPMREAHEILPLAGLNLLVVPMLYLRFGKGRRDGGSSPKPGDSAGLAAAGGG